jgi:4-amino-4-deoxy-L-arabinose transferase-like glycosyltransferase
VNVNTSATGLHLTENNSASERRRDFLAVGIIALYCLAYAAMRLLISHSMELSEAEQYLDASVFSFGYRQQAPLYSWIVRAAASLFGMNVVTITAVKYSLLFMFYFFLFLLARNFWDSKKSLLVTASMLLFPTFSYEVHRDLTHTILVSLIAVIICFLYIRMLREAKTGYYLLAGILAGMGMLSKYNFIFFLAAFLLAILSCREGRGVVFDKKIFLSILCASLVFLPHFIWLVRENFMSVHYALVRSKTGGLALDTPLRVLYIVGITYLEVLIFLIVSAVFFRISIFKVDKDDTSSGFFRRLAMFGLTGPVIVIFLLKTDNFSSRWLAPFLFALPLAVFSAVKIDRTNGRFRLFGFLCMFIAVSVLAVRIFIGFFPDTAGKVERIHIPYKALSRQLTDRLGENGVRDVSDFVIVAESHNDYIAANLMTWMHVRKFVRLRDFVSERSVRDDVMERGGIFVCHISGKGIKTLEKFVADFFPASSIVILRSPYLHSSKLPPCVMGVVIIPKRQIHAADRPPLSNSPEPLTQKKQFIQKIEGDTGSISLPQKM